MLKVKEYNTHDPTSVLKDTNVGYITQPKEVEELKEKIRKLEDNCSTLIKSNLKLTETNTELIKENKELTTRLREMAKNVDAVSATMGKEELH